MAIEPLRRVAITGASGFVGRRLTIRAANAGFSLRTLSRADATYPIDETNVSAIADADAVVHLAAFVPSRMDDSSLAEECMRVNAMQTLQLLRACERAGVRHFIYVSSGNAYAPGPGLRTENDALFPRRRGAYYLASKMAGEVFACAASLSTTILRPSSIYGPGVPSSAVLRLFVNRLRESQRVTIKEGGAFGADFVFVDDVADLILAVLRRRATGIYNAGCGVRTTLDDAARLIARELRADRAEIVIEGEHPTAFVGFAALDISKARRDLAYAPRTLESGIREWLAQEHS